MEFGEFITKTRELGFRKALQLTTVHWLGLTAFEQVILPDPGQVNGLHTEPNSPLHTDDMHQLDKEVLAGPNT